MTIVIKSMLPRGILVLIACFLIMAEPPDYENALSKNDAIAKAIINGIKPEDRMKIKKLYLKRIYNISVIRYYEYIEWRGGGDICLHLVKYDVSKDRIISIGGIDIYNLLDESPGDFSYNIAIIPDEYIIVNIFIKEDAPFCLAGYNYIIFMNIDELKIRLIKKFKDDETSICVSPNMDLYDWALVDDPVSTWDGYDPAVQYRYQVYTDDGNIVIRKIKYSWDLASAKKVRKASKVFWRVQKVVDEAYPNELDKIITFKMRPKTAKLVMDSGYYIDGGTILKDLKYQQPFLINN